MEPASPTSEKDAVKRTALTLILAVTSLMLTANPANAYHYERAIAIVGYVPNVDQGALMDEWSASPYIRLFPAYTCDGHKSCITVSERPMGSYYAGYGWYNTYYNGDFRGYAQINSSMTNFWMRRQSMCHELGHNFYLPHGSGCMAATVYGNAPRPNSTNLNTAR